MDKYYVLTFYNTQGAIKAEQELKKLNIPVTIMPTPTQITRSCGISLRFDYEQIDKIKILMNEKTIDVNKILLREEKGYRIIE